MRAILTFHSVDDSGSVISYPPARFAQFIAALGRQGVPIVDLDTLLSPSAPEGVAITFDDGMHSVARHALPVLRDHGAPAHLFLTTWPVGQSAPWPDQPTDIPSFPMLSWDDIDELVDGGIFIESHTHTHPDLRATSDEDMARECDLADELIEARTGRRPKYFAYPFGYFDERSLAFARARYAGTVTTELRTLSDHEDPAALPRLDTYYLQSPTSFERITDASMQAYLSTRSLMRTLRGTQTIPETGTFAAIRRAMFGGPQDL